MIITLCMCKNIILSAHARARVQLKRVTTPLQSRRRFSRIVRVSLADHVRSADSRRRPDRKRLVISVASGKRRVALSHARTHTLSLSQWALSAGACADDNGNAKGVPSILTSILHNIYIRDDKHESRRYYIYISCTVLHIFL